MPAGLCLHEGQYLEVSECHPWQQWLQSKLADKHCPAFTAGVMRANLPALLLGQNNSSAISPGPIEGRSLWQSYITSSVHQPAVFLSQQESETDQGADTITSAGPERLPVGAHSPIDGAQNQAKDDCEE